MTAFQSVGGLSSGLVQNQKSAAGGIIASSSTGYADKTSDNGHSDEVNKIRETGFMAYVKDIEEQKIKEMREKILQSMGLDEEKLAAMPADQRAALEKSISERIQQQLDVASMTNNSDDEDEKDGTKNLDRNMAQMSFDPQMYAALTMIQERDQQIAENKAELQGQQPEAEIDTSFGLSRRNGL
ncbi:hypothetical protein [Thalassospira marina]|uniref:Uncharacterized protein n=1 Tax=Thalassospira marina TaxID=2048283 RepID=A0A2N3KQR2_9PROT|nr:hypothetical protein [Thalassospira marina]PKR52894.1 hypothetical protein COO20_16470 [Thalassospira marina]